MCRLTARDSPSFSGKTPETPSSWARDNFSSSINGEVSSLSLSLFNYSINISPISTNDETARSHGISSISLITISIRIILPFIEKMYTIYFIIYDKQRERERETNKAIDVDITETLIRFAKMARFSSRDILMCIILWLRHFSRHRWYYRIIFHHWRESAIRADTTWFAGSRFLSQTTKYWRSFRANALSNIGMSSSRCTMTRSDKFPALRYRSLAIR